ncbi:hypothetical protein LTR47_001930 [Exophiala xenobiotica]|nr:hypothetical protein LTR47_001930 [Exophiala xenobiotica]KAK5251076.1 hypothetical protein LTS06_004226 [Exophiala xenobiotica]KAK5356311.1 hypothetical protein LTR61_000046 [Exophiala xenobiotica]KAK5370781.1 hypothetical protein LTS03_007145 [Exophiala xenobiotica]
MSPSLQGDCGPGVLQMSLSPSEPNSDSIPHESNGTVSNPLGLVADACGEAQALYQEPNAALSLLDRNADSINLLNTSGQAEPAELARNLLGQSGYVSIGRNLNKETLEYGLCTLLRDEVRTCRYKGYFRQPDMKEDRDTGPDLDPVDLGLVSMEEAYYLFPCFFERLHPINGILDPMLHTPEFVRSRSALLFTWILAISAQYDHQSGAISKRLRIHGEHLSKHVHASGAKSVEIAQGYYISLLSAAPANTLAEERSWLYTIHAFGVAAELGLDREAPTSGLSHNILGLKRPSQLAARHYQDLESSVAASGELGDQADDPAFAERLARNRERTWLRILLWERAHSAARGRVSAFPETELTRTIETWYLHPLADPNDKYTCAFILLRRHLGVLNDELKRQLRFPHTSRHWVRELFDLTLQPWCLAWLQPSDAPLTPSERISNTFLRYVYLHGRLWTLSFALHGHSGGTQEDADAIKEDCFEAAVNCCEIAVQDLQEIGEPLYCMLAPTWAMISYTAVLALRLFPLLYRGQVAREVELLALLAQVALQLERAGTTPSHRFGIAAILGQHLFMILRTRLDLVLSAAHAQAQSSQSQGSGPVDINYQGAHGLEPMNNNSNHQPESSLQSFDPFSSAFDPFLTLPLLPGEENGSTEWFTGVLWDWAGQGFESIA